MCHENHVAIRFLRSSLFEMVVDQVVIQIGADCPPGSPTCVPPTAGMLAAKDVLEGLETEQLAVAPCVDVVP